MSRATPLDPLRFPLQGSQLIEASAGTGKTYTIALLYLRLILGHGAGESARRPLMPPDILVVTFTEAATDELRGRIRTRLSEAAALFRGDPGPADDDEALRELLAEHPEPGRRQALAQRLQRAADSMDEAAIATIHGWCHRMLREHAFDSGSLFSQTLQPDQSGLRAQALRDWWRTHIAPLPPDLARTALDGLGSPAAIERTVDQALAVADLLPAPDAPAQRLRANIAERARAVEPLKAQWRAWVPTLRGLLDAAHETRQFDRRRLKPEYYGRWLDQIIAWADDPSLIEPEVSEKFYERLTREGLMVVCATKPPDGGTSPLQALLAHPAIGEPPRLRAALAALPDDTADLLAHAARSVRDQIARDNVRLARFGFDDLLTRFEAALRGPRGAALSARIREQFPVAMIDEFQDTDPVQYGIVDAIYRVASNAADTCLVLIGDPKQAIYGFRGADIHTYLRARQDCAGRLHTLTRNFRGTPQAVAAVNHLFERAETGARGAFRFGNAADNPLPFAPVRAKGRDDDLLIDGKAPVGLTLCALDALPEGRKPVLLTAGQAQPRMASAFARTIADLLEAGRRRRAVLRGSAGERPLLPADIAVLVSHRGEAAMIRAALARLGVRTVYLSDRDSVYDSEQAWELLCWLEACAAPTDERRLRTALATPSLGLSLSELAELGTDEQVWETRVLQFRALREVWRVHGVLPMLRRLLTEFDVPARLLAQPATDEGPAGSAPVSGERRLTDLLHLAELMQQASAWLDGEQALIRHLAAERAGEAGVAGIEGGPTQDDRQVRLESDADLVTVVTVHKSKGLEYPLVFLPFGGDCRPVTRKDRLLNWHDGHERRATLRADDEQVRRADEERRREDLRKLYVALTRARFATWVGVATTGRLEDSALGHLIGDEPVAAGALVGRLRACAEGCADIAVEALPPMKGRAQRGASDDDMASSDDLVAADQDERPAGGAAAAIASPCPELPSGGAARRPQRDPSPAWWIASYSAIARTQGTAPTAPDSPQEANLVEARQEADAGAPAFPDAGAAPAAAGAATASATRAAADPHAFPRGPEAGTFLHDLLEWVAREGCGSVCARPDTLRDQIARRCQVRGWQRWIDPLAQWLNRLLLTPIDPGSGCRPLRLADLETATPELEFWLSAGATDTRLVDRLVTRHTLEGAPRPAIAAQTIHGMLKGYIDLVFEHDGRYWVADYKSNWLGPDARAYDPQTLRASVLAARYDLQYTLYLVALHRLLAARLPDYDYERHVGGALYLYLRGIDAPGAGVHRERPPRELIERLDRLLAGEPEGQDAP